MTTDDTKDTKPRHIMDRDAMMAAIGVMRPLYTKEGGSARLALSQADIDFMLVQIKQHASLKKLAVSVAGGPGDFTITLTPPIPKPVGRPTSAARQAIEAIKPGLFESFPIEGPDSHSPETVKMMVQAAQRKLQRRYRVEVLADDGVTMVTRIDSLDEASPAVRADVEARLAPKYPFATMAIDAEHVVPLDAGIENLRTMATYQKSKHGKVFSINKRDGGIVIKRVK